MGRAEEAEELATKVRAMSESQGAKLIAARRAAEDAADRADRAETELQEVRSASAADRDAALEAAAAAASAKEHVTSLQTQLDNALTKSRQRDERVKADQSHYTASIASLEAEASAARTRAEEAEKTSAQLAEDLKAAGDRARTAAAAAATNRTSGVMEPNGGGGGAFGLSGLGLESIKLSGSIELPSSFGGGGATRDSGGGGLMAGGGKKAGQKLLSVERAASLGKISLRTWLLLTYLFLLHIMAMVTPRHNVGCEDDHHRLPGLR